MLSTPLQFGCLGVLIGRSGRSIFVAWPPCGVRKHKRNSCAIAQHSISSCTSATMKQALGSLSSVQDRPAHAMHVCPRLSLLPSHAPDSRHHHQSHSMQLRHHQQSSRLRAQQKTAEPQSLRAPGSESNFDDVPKNRDEITLTTPVSDKQMQVLPCAVGGCQRLRDVGYMTLTCMDSFAGTHRFGKGGFPSGIQGHPGSGPL